MTSHERKESFLYDDAHDEIGNVIPKKYFKEDRDHPWNCCDLIGTILLLGVLICLIIFIVWAIINWNKKENNEYL